MMAWWPQAEISSTQPAAREIGGSQKGALIPRQVPTGTFTKGDRWVTDHPAQPVFDRLHGTYTDLPNIRWTKPSTVQEALPFVGNVSTHVVQTLRTEDGGFMVFIQIVDADGRARLVLPSKVCQSIYRQHQSLVDRSTPESRKRKAAQRQRARVRAQKEARKAARVAATKGDN